MQFAQLFLLSMFAVVALHPELMRDLDVDNSLGEVYDPATDSTHVIGENGTSYLSLRNYYSYNWVRNRAWTNGEQVLSITDGLNNCSSDYSSSSEGKVTLGSIYPWQIYIGSLTFS